jgi:hypothetical protein
VSAVTGPVLGTVQAAAHPILETVQSVASPLLSTVQAVTQPAVSTVQAVTHPLVAAAEVVAAPVLSTAQEVAQPVVSAVPAVTQPVLDTVGAVASAVPGVVQAVTHPVLTAAQAVAGPVPDQVPVVADVGKAIGIGVNTDPGQAPDSGGTVTLPPIAAPGLPTPQGSEPVPDGRPVLVIDAGLGGSTPAVPGVHTAQATADPPALPFPALAITSMVAAPRPAPRLSRDLVLVADPANGADPLPAERLATAADQAPRDTVLAQALPADPFLDLALWGAADDDTAADGMAAELPAEPAAPVRLTASPTVLAEALLPDGGAEVLDPAQADLRDACVPFDARALEADLRRLLDQLQGLAWDLSSLLARLQGTPWFVAAALLAATCEVGRRRLRQRARAGLALAGGGGTLTWFPTRQTPP